MNARIHDDGGGVASRRIYVARFSLIISDRVARNEGEVRYADIVAA